MCGKKSFSFCATLLLLTTAACVELDEVSKWAAESTKADSSLSDLAADLKHSCERFNTFRPEGAEPRDCSQYDQLGTSVLVAQSVLLNYMQVLGSVASDKAVTFQGSLNGLPGQLAPAGWDANEVTATTSLVDKTFEAAVNGYRRKKLTDLVGSTNADVQNVSNKLAAIIGKDYKQLLQNESDQMENFYQDALHNAPANQGLDKLLVVNLWNQQKASLAEKSSAADAYVKMITSIATGHQKLYDHRNDMGAKQLMSDLGPEIQDISSSAMDVYKAFK